MRGQFCCNAAMSPYIGSGKDIDGSHDRASRLVSHESGLERKPAGVRPGPASAHDPLLTFRLTRDSRGDKASPMRRGTSATEGAWQNRGSPQEAKMKLGHASSSSSALASCRTGVSKPSVNQP
jgi:hypothetical protein